MKHLILSALALSLFSACGNSPKKDGEIGQYTGRQGDGTTENEQRQTFENDCKTRGGTVERFPAHESVCVEEVPVFNLAKRKAADWDGDTLKRRISEPFPYKTRPGWRVVVNADGAFPPTEIKYGNGTTLLTVTSGVSTTVVTTQENVPYVTLEQGTYYTFDVTQQICRNRFGEVRCNGLPF